MLHDLISSEERIKATDDMVDLSGLQLDQRLYPIVEFRQSVNHVFRSHGPELLKYGDPFGYEPLRKYIANRMRIHGVSISEDEILLTNGSQQGLDLVLRCLAKPGNRVAVESPSYSRFLPLLKYYDTEVVEIPILQDGIDLKLLKQEMEKTHISMIYTIPNFHNPTGITSSHENREELLRLAQEHSTVIIEDGFEEEMKYYGKVVLPIKSMDKNQIVIYLGTFSKVLFPGVRMGWVAAEKELIKRITSVKRYSDLSNNTLMQASIETFCKNGHYDRHVKRVHFRFRKRMAVALEALSKYMPSGFKWTEPDGGYTIWVSSEKEIEDVRNFEKLQEKYKVRVSPGNHHFLNENTLSDFRISISSLNEEEIEEGIKRLSNVLKEV